MIKLLINPIRQVSIVFCIVSLLFSQDFAKVITVSGGGVSYNLRFGFSQYATDGFDPDSEPFINDNNCSNTWQEGDTFFDLNGNDVQDGIDLYAPPAAPPQPAFDAAFLVDADRYYNQIFYGDGDNSTEHEWPISLQYDTSDPTITITWNNTGWGGLGSFVLSDAFTGTMIDIDMADLDPATVNDMVGTLDTSDPSNPVLTLTSSMLTTVKIKVTPSGNSSPNALFTADGDIYDDVGLSYVGTGDFSVPFTDQSLSGNSNISSWLWNFGDGATSTDQNPTNTFSISDGSLDEYFDVSLTVTDENGVSETTVRENFIYVGTPPTADFTYEPFPDPAQDENWDTTYVFDASASVAGSSSLTSWSCSWDFNEDGIEDADSWDFSFTFGAGVYSATLVVTDAKGLSDSITKTDIISLDGPKADFSADVTSGDPVLTVQFTDESILEGPGTIVSRKWDFNFEDGLDWDNPDATSDGGTVSYTFSEPEVYQVSLLIESSDGLVDGRTQGATIKVGGVHAHFSAAPMDGLDTSTVTFTNEEDAGSLEIWARSWIIGKRIPNGFSQGNALSDTTLETHPPYTFTEPGAYQVTFTTLAQGAFSDSDTEEKYIVVEGSGGPTAGFTSSINGGTVDFTDASTVSGCAVMEWRWDFGDGSDINDDQNPGHTYSAIGAYTVRLVVVDADSLPSSVTQDITITTLDEELSVGEYIGIMPNKYHLENAYPNPFNPVTTINFTIPKAENVNLVIYDVLGREIRTLANEIHAPNIYSIQWNGTDNFGKSMSTGIYFYKLVSGDFIQVKKLLLLK